MDIQGAEALALSGMRGLLARGEDVHLFCEFWPHGLAHAGSSAAAFLDDLQRLGFEFPWIDHFAAARNACIEHATGDFIFWLDADDRLDEANRQKLAQLFASLPAGNVAYSMKCRCLAAPGQEATVVDHIRLFRNDP